METSTRFYRELLGLEPEVETPHWSSYMLGRVRIGLHPPFQRSIAGTRGGWVLGVETGDLASLRRRLEAQGVSCAAYHNVPGGVVMDFQDPDGNRLQAIQLGAKAESLAA